MLHFCCFSGKKKKEKWNQDCNTYEPTDIPDEFIAGICMR